MRQAARRLTSGSGASAWKPHLTPPTDNSLPPFSSRHRCQRVARTLGRLGGRTSGRRSSAGPLTRCARALAGGSRAGHWNPACRGGGGGGATRVWVVCQARLGCSGWHCCTPSRRHPRPNAGDVEDEIRVSKGYWPNPGFACRNQSTHTSTDSERLMRANPW